jgi:mannose-6-phosphate isomerase-like protein (cupin superfamily)
MMIKKMQLFLLLLLAGLTSNVSAQVIVKDTTKTWKITDCVNQFDMAKKIPTDAGYQYWFVDQKFLDGRTIKLSVVAPGKYTHKPHSHPEDEFYFILEGTAKFYLNGDSITSGQYSTFYCPPNTMHGIANAGETELKYLVIKKYDR